MDRFDYYDKLKAYNFSDKGLKERAIFLEYLDKYTKLNLSMGTWTIVVNVLGREKHYAQKAAEENFKKAKTHLIGRINHPYEYVGNWVDKTSDFDYAINTVRVWAEVVGFLNDGKVDKNHERNNL